LDQRPQSEVEFSPVELVGLEILVGFHPIDRFAQLVQIANGAASAVGIKKPPYGFSHDAELTDRQVASLPIQPLEVIQSSSAVFGWRRSTSPDAWRKNAVRIEGQNPFQPNVPEIHRRTENPLRCPIHPSAKAVGFLVRFL
jgi:hypothetical protein